MFKTTLMAAAVGTMLAATPAVAGSTSESQTVEVGYRDLNLGTVEGQKQLQRRIDYAASKICKLGEPRTGTRIPSANSKKCYAKARAGAESQMAILIADRRAGG